MKLFRLLITGCLLSFLTGCFQVTTVVRVNPDGSGTVEESMMLSKKMVAQIDEMIRSFAGEGVKKPKPLELFEPAKLKEQARSMGKGVTYRSGKKMETADYTGYIATYTFTDINNLKLSQKTNAPTEKKAKALPLIFRFSKGSPATLTIVQPVKEGKEATAAPAPEPAAQPDAPPLDDEKAKKMMELFMGMKFVLAVEMNGTIISTNAAHHDGNRLTLVDFDLSRLGSAGPELEKLGMLQNGSIEDAKELLQNIPGMKFDMNPTLTVVFKK